MSVELISLKESGNGTSHLVPLALCIDLAGCGRLRGRSVVRVNGMADKLRADWLSFLVLPVEGYGASLFRTRAKLVASLILSTGFVHMVVEVVYCVFPAEVASGGYHVGVRICEFGESGRELYGEFLAGLR